jgi:lipopolysaccharide transport system permease protein
MTTSGDMSVSATKIPVSRMTVMEGGVDAPAPAATAHVAPAADAENELVIEPKRGWIGLNWGELVRSRELLYFLIWRDIKVRYKQAVLGVAWAVLQPALQMIVFTLIFGVAARFKHHLPVPYAVFVLCGLLPWQLFATSLNTGGMSLVNQQHLLTKIYFPRLFIPTAVIGGALMDMGVAALLFAGMLLFSGITPTWEFLFLPLLLALSLLMSLGMAYLLSALTVTYRDFRFVIPVLSQLWMWLSFVAFPAKLVENFRHKWLFALNPMYSVVAAYRKALLGHKLSDAEIGWDLRYLTLSVAMALALFVLGLFYFRRTERRFADFA